MKITLNKLFLIILFILNVSCKSGTSPPNNSECIADCADVCGGSAVLSGCDNTCGSTLENDACDICGGEITNESDCPDMPGGTVEINYNSDTPIAGFQFTVEGVTVTGAGGGDAEAAGFTISSSASTVLGFSLSGATIPDGAGVLVVLEVEGDAGSAPV